MNSIYMDNKILLNDVKIRTSLQPGDIGYITYLHGSLYKNEYNYGISFEVYVAEGLCEFYHNYLYFQFLHEHGYTASYLWTTHEQETAARLYRKFGFQLVEEKPSTDFGKPLKEQKYEWKK
jgi:hypothetical protein